MSLVKDGLQDKIMKKLNKEEMIKFILILNWQIYLKETIRMNYDQMIINLIFS